MQQQMIQQKMMQQQMFESQNKIIRNNMFSPQNRMQELILRQQNRKQCDCVLNDFENNAIIEQIPKKELNEDVKNNQGKNENESYIQQSRRI